MKEWQKCRNILCIRADNMGDLIMTTPAFRALKETFNCRLTVLTSLAGSLIIDCIPEIDEVIISNLPWVKCVNPLTDIQLQSLIKEIREKEFDGVIIFTVYSQSALPAALFSLLAGIPRRLAYGRENPYELLTDWLPDKEPYSYIQHQVQRDINLVKSIGAYAFKEELSLQYSTRGQTSALKKLEKLGINTAKPWLVFHPGVSEERRSYPFLYWIKIGQLLAHADLPILFTGSSVEIEMTDALSEHAGAHTYSVAGLFTIEEFVALIAVAKAVVSVNTSTIHIAAATQTPSVVLYALTNPQHTPWQSPHTLLTYSVKEIIQSKNEVVRYVSEHNLQKNLPYPSPEKVVNALREILDRPN
ncbi:glycosyltransferase family 9 protein [Emticicia sp. TH156]|uniref:glycosyltransferase family 9 protein n=1 Tax=Emticicia sp. TH156 TaxID=2067454 RepID=UPI000C75E5FA|nr:glycosyltransferase family 9 protein [Emticicia sp. TH156]PLK42477.1 glycosyltransferase family 9 protein [Emticicia sp. TH156]